MNKGMPQQVFTRKTFKKLPRKYEINKYSFQR